MLFYFKTGIPKWKEAKTWGDYHFANALAVELEKQGHCAVIQIHPEWYTGDDRNSDVTIHIKGLSRYIPKKGPLNVIWLISHPEKTSIRELNRYDIIFVASRMFARRLQKRIDRPVYPLLQFADSRLMYPDQDRSHTCDLLFLGNSRKVHRKIIRDLSFRSLNLHVWGRDWEKLIDKKYVKGSYFPYERARVLYSSASIVLNDHWKDMAHYGFCNNRIFDALACRAFVISDRCHGLSGLFPGGLVTYQGKNDLQYKIVRYLNDTVLRKMIADRGFRAVSRHHTVRRRVRELLDFLSKGRPSTKRRHSFADRIYRKIETQKNQIRYRI
jgi:spore maturation protein CgeB